MDRQGPSPGSKDRQAHSRRAARTFRGIGKPELKHDLTGLPVSLLSSFDDHRDALHGFGRAINRHGRCLPSGSLVSTFQCTASGVRFACIHSRVAGSMGSQQSVSSCRKRARSISWIVKRPSWLLTPASESRKPRRFWGFRSFARCTSDLKSNQFSKVRASQGNASTTRESTSGASNAAMSRAPGRALRTGRGKMGKAWIAERTQLILKRLAWVKPHSVAQRRRQRSRPVLEK